LVPWVLIFVIFFLCLLITFEAPKLSVEIVRSKRSTCVWYVMTTSIKVWTPYLDKIMSTKSLLCKWQDHVKLFTYHLKSNFSNNGCNDIMHHIMHVSMYVHYHVHISKVECQMSQLVVYTQQRRLAIDKCESLNKIQRIVAKIANGRQNMRMVSQALSHEAWTMKRGGFNEFQTLFKKNVDTHILKMERECWCTHFKMKSNVLKWFTNELFEGGGGGF